MSKVKKMDNIEFSQKLEIRTKKFAINLIQISAILPKNLESNVIRNQLTKSGTSVGANYKEANRPRSKADFKNKINICKSEASETVYWLEIISELKWINSHKIKEILGEANELLAIFTSIGKKLK